MAVNFKPYRTSTVDAYIDEGKRLDVSEETIAYKAKIDDAVIIPYHNVITKYYRAINRYIIETVLSEEDYQKYYQQPKLYCHDMYGTPELAYSLLFINSMASVMDFKKRKIKIFADNILEILNELMALNEEDMIKNRAYIREY